MKRILEPELMDTPEAAEHYDGMDHDRVNRTFAEEFLNFVHQSYHHDLESVTWEILDVGTATARLPIEICRLNHNAQVMAVDAAACMLERAVYNVEAAGMRERIALAKVDAKSMPYDDGSIEMVIANSLHHHLPDPAICFAEMHRVAEPDGILFARDLLRPADQDALDALVRTHGAGETSACQSLLADSLAAALTIDEVRDMIEALGYPRDTVSTSSDRHWTWAAVKP